MDRRTFLVTAAGATAVGVAGCSSSAGQSESEADEYDIGMTARRFDPATVTVSPGETVVWKNTSSPAHTVTAYEEELPDGVDFFASGEADSEDTAREAWHDGFGGALDADDTYEHTFEVAGEHPYFCIPHEVSGMTGVVIVE